MKEKKKEYSVSKEYNRPIEEGMVPSKELQLISLSETKTEAPVHEN